MPRRATGREAQQVVIDEYLPVAARARSDADRGDVHGSAVIRAAESAGMHSSTMANAPASCGRPGVGQQPLRVRAARDSRPWMHVLRPQAAMGHHRNARGDQAGNHVGLLHAAFQLHGLAAGLLQDPAGIFDRPLDSQVKTGKRHVDHQQGLPHRPAHHRPRGRSSRPASRAAYWRGLGRPSRGCRRPECPRCPPHRPLRPWRSRRR